MSCVSIVMNTSGSGSGMVDRFTCTDSSTFSPDSISNQSLWMIRSDIADNGGIPTAIVLSIMFVIAFVWNLFILVTYCYKYHLLKFPANIFLFTLALADFIVSVTVLPASAITFAAREFVIGMTDQVRCDFCYLQGFLMVFCPVVSINILAILSIDRFFLLYKPLVYKKKESPMLAIIIIICVWIFSAFLCILPAFGFGEWEFNQNIGSCMARFTPTSNLFFVFVLVVYSLIPIVVLGITNIWTYKIVAKFLRRRLVRRRSYRGSFREQKEDNVHHHQQQTQLVKVFGALFIANIVVWSPVIIMVFVLFIVDASKIPGWPYVIFWIIVVSNSLVHPILESFFNKELRLVVNKGKKTVGRTVRSTSKSLVRMVTTDSMRNMSFSDDDTLKDDKRGDSSFMNSTVVTDLSGGRNSTSPSFGFKFTPDVDRKFDGLEKNKLRKSGGCPPPPSPLTKRQTSPVFNFTTNDSNSVDDKGKRSISVVITDSYTSNRDNRSSSPFEYSKPTTPMTPGKRRQVSISLPDDNIVYYPAKARTPTLIQQDAVFEDDSEDLDSEYSQEKNWKKGESDSGHSSTEEDEHHSSADASSKHSSKSSIEHACENDNGSDSIKTDEHKHSNGIHLSELVNNAQDSDEIISDNDDNLV